MAASGEERLEGSWARRPPAALCLDFFEQPMVLSAAQLLPPLPGPAGPEVPAPVQSQGGAQQRLPQLGLGQHGSPGERRRLSEGSPGREQRPAAVPGTQAAPASFCSREKSLLCPGCLEGTRATPPLSAPAAQQYKDLLDDLLESLRKEEQKVLHQRQAEEESRSSARREAGGGPGAGVPAGAAPGEAADLAGLAGRAGGEDGGRVGGGPGPALQLGLLPAAADGPDGEEVPPGRRGILAGHPGHHRQAPLRAR
ncbi:hypothetical protein E2320_022446 [Naja naja]|nr:hypothetical protein E2320_022446 [Naja naja]